jgi:hypothetical protein
MTYEVPVALPAANLSVTLTATSVADSTKSASAAITVPQIPGFAGVSEAHVDTVNRRARLIMNGKPAPPLWFQYLQNFPSQIQFLAPELQDASSNGIQTVSVSLNWWPWDNQGQAPLDFSVPDQVIDNHTDHEPASSAGAEHRGLARIRLGASFCTDECGLHSLC